MHYHTSEPKKTSIAAVLAASPYKESVTNARLPFPFSLDCFVLTQRRLQLHCIFFPWRSASNHVDLTQWATTEETHTGNNQELWLLEQMEFTSTLPMTLRVSNFCCRTSAAMQLWIGPWKGIQNEWNSSECDFWQREQYLCVRVRASFPQGTHTAVRSLFKLAGQHHHTFSPPHKHIAWISLQGLTEGQRSQLHQIATQTGLMQFGESRQSFIRFNTDGISAFCVAAGLWCLSLVACKGKAVLLSLH